MPPIDWSDIEALRRARPALILEALTDGDAAAFERALAEGFDPDVFSEHGGSKRTALHHAAGAGDVAALRRLVEHGAARDVVDPTYDATPVGWAEFFEQPEAAEYLRSLDA